MSDIQSIVNSVLARAAKVDPVLLNALQLILDEVTRIGIIVDPVPIIGTKISSETFGAPPSVDSFSYRLTRRNVILEWEPSDDSSIYFELRKGSDWDIATLILITGNRQAILDPLTTGDHEYLLRTLSFDSIYSDEIESVTVSIPPVGAVAIMPQTIDQNVLLYWTIPTSVFDIDYYILKRNGTLLGNVNATFAPITELIKDTYEYSVTPVDIAGNLGPETVVTVIVAGPPDFILRSEFECDFSGPMVNAKELIKIPPSLLLPINLTETWEDHFVNNSWNTIADQIAAGYPYYIQPTLPTASHTQEFDVGIIYPASVITISHNLLVLDGAFTVGVSTRVSDDGVIWSAPQVGQSVFFESLRYIEVTIEFTGGDDTALLELFNFHVSVSVKQSMDSGKVSALASDVSGTVVTFNVAFKDIDSLTLTVEETTGPFTAIYDFNDIPNPVDFAVYVFNVAGSRVSKEVSWKARGII